jgi:hypothetical protein
MQHIHFRVLLIFALALAAGIIFSSCSKESNPVTNYIYTHSDSALVGDMVGFVDLYDSTYSSYIYGRVSGHSEATISIDGTPFTATSDSIGKWTMKNIPAGTYNITISKSGYAMVKLIAYKFIGNGTDFLERISLYKVPLLHPDLVTRPFYDYYTYFWRDTLYVDRGDTIRYAQDSVYHPLGIATFTGSVAEDFSYGDIGHRYMDFYLGKTENIDPLDPNSFIYTTGPLDANRNSDPNSFLADLYDLNLFRDSLYMLGFNSGEKIYIAAYVCTAPCRYIYFTDINTGKHIYTGFSPIHSEVRNFILP